MRTPTRTPPQPPGLARAGQRHTNRSPDVRQHLAALKGVRRRPSDRQVLGRQALAARPPLSDPRKRSRARGLRHVLPERSLNSECPAICQRAVARSCCECLVAAATSGLSDHAHDASIFAPRAKRSQTKPPIHVHRRSSAAPPWTAPPPPPSRWPPSHFTVVTWLSCHPSSEGAPPARRYHVGFLPTSCRSERSASQQARTR